MVEGEFSIRWPITEYLRQTGWVVIEGYDAVAAMHVINSGAKVDIAFVDFRLPGGPTGQMFAQWLAIARPSVPVLLTSGLTSSAPGFVAGQLRAYIAKPYSFHDVSQMLTEMLNPAGTGNKLASLMTAQTECVVPHRRLHRILIVDDDVDAAVALSLLLKLGGHTTALAHSGIEALEAAANFRPDFVLLDLGLPGIDGYEAARTIRRQTGPGNPFLVAVTGWCGPEDRVRSKQAGFDEHLTKPVDISVIELLLASLPYRRGEGADSLIASDDSIAIPR